MLIAQYHKKERQLKELEAKLEWYKESFETMKDNITELKHLNKVLVNQISSLSSTNQKSWAKFIPCMKLEM